MKTKKKMQSAIKIVFTKEFAGQSVGNVIATDMATVNFLIKKGVCKNYVESNVKQPIKTTQVEKPKIKKQVTKKKVAKK